jgi:hypothetical protein
MTTKIAPHMFKKRIVRNTNGQIIDLYDESGGGWIIQKGNIVNEEAYNEIARREEEARTATAKAIANQRVDDNLPDRNVTGTEAIKNNSRLDELEEKIKAQDGKLDAILKALSK